LRGDDKMPYGSSAVGLTVIQMHEREPVIGLVGGQLKKGLGGMRAKMEKLPRLQREGKGKTPSN